ncbi:MAG: hypothetical protein RR101_14730 [Burkholderiaceae bacterium]
MSDWRGASRSNYFALAPHLERAFDDVVRLSGIEAIQGVGECSGRWSITPGDPDSGDWDSTLTLTKSEVTLLTSHGVDIVLSDGEDMCDKCDDDVVEVFFDMSWIYPLLADGEVMVIETVGAEKRRYVTGSAEAYTRLGPLASISMKDIYERVAWAGFNNLSLPHF